jgi:hypothetical protein
MPGFSIEQGLLRTLGWPCPSDHHRGAVIVDALRRHNGHDVPVDNTELITYVRLIADRKARPAETGGTYSRSQINEARIVRST